MFITQKSYLALAHEAIDAVKALAKEKEDHMITREKLDFYQADIIKIQWQLEALQELNVSNITWMNYYKNRYDKVKDTKEDKRADKITYLKKLIIKQFKHKSLKQISKETWIDWTMLSRIKLWKYKPWLVATENYISKFEVTCIQ